MPLGGRQDCRGDLSEAEWRLLEPLLPPERGRKSRPAFDDRQIVNGILWRIRTGAPWRDLPEKYGKWMTVYQHFRRWSGAGIWEAVAKARPGLCPLETSGSRERMLSNASDM